MKQPSLIGTEDESALRVKQKLKARRDGSTSTIHLREGY